MSGDELRMGAGGPVVRFHFGDKTATRGVRGLTKSFLKSVISRLQGG